MELPICCQNCRHIPQEAKNYLPDVHSCWLSVILPYKKQTCKRQGPPNDVNRPDAFKCKGCDYDGRPINACPVCGSYE